MTQLYTKVKLYLEANSKTWDNTKVSLQNDGSGDYIKSWSYDIAEPTDEQLSTYKDEANAEEALNIVYRNRISEYPPIGDQLDMLWHSIDEDPALKQKYFKFYEACKAVKAKYPK